MILKFTKMHGAGNDFVVVDLISQRCSLRPRDVRKLADRRFGVGCDQVLLVEPPGDPAVPAGWVSVADREIRSLERDRDDLQPRADAREMMQFRAILRCGARGGKLPLEIREACWNKLVTFNPERMRLR